MTKLVSGPEPFAVLVLLLFFIAFTEMTAVARNDKLPGVF